MALVIEPDKVGKNRDQKENLLMVTLLSNRNVFGSTDYLSNLNNEKMTSIQETKKDDNFVYQRIL